MAKQSKRAAKEEVFVLALLGFAVGSIVFAAGVMAGGSWS